MKNINKKKIFFCFFLIVVCIIGVTMVYLRKSEKILYPRPDKIIVYKDEEIIEVKNSNELFQKLYELNGIPKDKNLLETSIEEETVEEIKNELALEYVYYDEQKMELVQGERTYTKLLFAYSGWCEDNVIFFNEGDYQSGTIFNKTSKRKLLSIYDNLVDEE